MNITLVVMAYLLIGFYELRQLARKGLTKEIWTVSILFLFGLVLSILLILQIRVPIPNIEL